MSEHSLFDYEEEASEFVRKNFDWLLKRHSPSLNVRCVHGLELSCYTLTDMLKIFYHFFGPNVTSTFSVVIENNHHILIRDMVFLITDHVFKTFIASCDHLFSNDTMIVVSESIETEFCGRTCKDLKPVLSAVRNVDRNVNLSDNHNRARREFLYIFTEYFFTRGFHPSFIGIDCEIHSKYKEARTDKYYSQEQAVGNMFSHCEKVLFKYKLESLLTRKTSA